MSLTTLKEELLQEFSAERLMITDQLEMLEPLALTLRKPAARYLLSSGTLIITEISCYIACACGLAFVLLMHKIYPLSLLTDIFYNAAYRGNLGGPHIVHLLLAVYGIAVLGIILLFIVARLAREIRLKNEILQMAGKDIKTIVGQHLERKAAFKSIEQRHMMGESTVTPTYNPRANVNDVFNPGYEDTL